MADQLIDDACDLPPLPEPAATFGWQPPSPGHAFRKETFTILHSHRPAHGETVSLFTAEQMDARILADRALRGDGKGEFFKLTRYGPTIRADVAEEAIAKGIEVNLVKRPSPEEKPGTGYEEVREALRPFAALLDQVAARDLTDHANVTCQVSVHDMRRAHAALRSLGGKP